MNKGFKKYIVHPTETITITPEVSAQTINVIEKAIASIEAMPEGEVGAVTASKAISNHIATVTPNVAAGTAGYNAHEAITGTDITVSASELVDGTTSITTTNATDVTNSQYAQVVDSNLIANNIRLNVPVLGITGTLAEATPIEVATASEMDALLTSENVGKAYRYVGESTTTYENGDIYVVREVS